ncbi:MAG: biopolymer transporter ExbD [Balneolales bacterium]|nr:biopolymer transporter ExbD [Balneolales bacterium]
MSHFKKKQASTSQEIPTTSMPDIIFILLIFFMVVTVLREVELLVRQDLTSAENIERIEEKRLVSYIYVGPQMLAGGGFGDTRVQVDDALVPPDDFRGIQNVMRQRRTDEPRLIVSLRVDYESEMGIVSDIKQQLRLADALRINYSTRRAQGAEAF